LLVTRLEDRGGTTSLAEHMKACPVGLLGRWQDSPGGVSM